MRNKIDFHFKMAPKGNCLSYKPPSLRIFDFYIIYSSLGKNLHILFNSYYSVSLLQGKYTSSSLWGGERGVIALQLSPPLASGHCGLTARVNMAAFSHRAVWSKGQRGMGHHPRGRVVARVGDPIPLGPSPGSCQQRVYSPLGQRGSD